MGFVALVNAVKIQFWLLCCSASFARAVWLQCCNLNSERKLKTSFTRAKHQVQYISVGYRGLRSLVATWKVYWFEKMTAGFFV